MPTSFRSSSRPVSSGFCSRPLAVLAAGVLSTTLLTACTVNEPLVTRPGDGVSSAPDTGPALAAQPDVVKAIGKTLRRRAKAVRAGRLGSFETGLSRREPALLTQQQTYFANLQQLPLGRFSYTLDPATLVRDGHRYWGEVTLRLQLEGYDDRPVASIDRFLFEPVGRKAARFRIASVSDLAWEIQHQVQPQPWDSGPIEVRSGGGVLGIFDPASVARAPEIMTSVIEGIRSVSGSVPYAWPGTVVVYALSTSGFLTSIDDLPGDDPEKLDGVAFPVRSRPGGPVASTRFVLHPRMLDHAGPERDRLVRHELTHVAVGTRDDLAPVWLSEGLAEYVSVRQLAPQDRLIPGAALEAARRGVDLMADDASFNGRNAATNYAIAWWACEYLADTAGPAAVWTLLDTFDRPDVDAQRQLRRMFGVGSKGLARRASRLIVATFDPPPPEPKPEPKPSTSPSGTASPSATP